MTYFEGAEEKKGKACKEEIAWVGEGERPEIYTDEHEKLLGNTERAWELFVDGYDKDGKRIYDPVTGKSCHQCRLVNTEGTCFNKKCRLIRLQV